MWDVERSGEVERLLALASCNQQFLSHGLYAGVVRQLQVVDTGHYWGEEVIRVFWRLKRLSHDRQRGIQAPETWDQPQVSDTDLVRTGLHILYIQKFKNSQVWLMLGSFCQGSCVKTLLLLQLWCTGRVCLWGDSPPTGSLGLPVTNCRKSLCCSASKLLNTSNRNRTARLQKTWEDIHVKCASWDLLMSRWCEN